MAKFTVATQDDINKGVLDAGGKDVSTPHNMFVDDDVYANVYNTAPQGTIHQRVEQAAAASIEIEAIFIALGSSDLESRQDPVSFDKFEQTPAACLNRLLGVNIDTRRLAVRTPVEFVDNVINVLADKWHP